MTDQPRTDGHAIRVGVVGLGAMGRPIANALRLAGYPVIGFDVAPAARERGAGDGIEPASSAENLATRSDLIITILPRARDVQEAVLGPAGIVAGIRPGSVLLDASTIDVATIRALEAPIAARGATLLDAGVSGSPDMAWERQLALSISGDETAVERCRPALEAFASNGVLYLGSLGSARVTKLAISLIAAVTTAALAEAFTLVVRNGGDPRVARQAIERSWANSALLAARPPLPGLGGDSPADHGYAAQFSIDYMVKDVDEALESARRSGAVLLTAGFVRQLFIAASAHGDGALDASALIRTIEALSRDEGDRAAETAQ